MRLERKTRRQVIAGLAGSAGLIAAGAGAVGIGARHARTTLVACMAEDPASLNPALSSATSTFEAGLVMYNGLLWMDADGKLHPDLAERFEIAPDADAFTFHLRRGVRWHDGAPFTAADVKFTISEVISKFQSVGRGAYKYLAGIDTPDDHTVVIRMTQPYLPFLNVPYAVGPILPRRHWEGTNFLRNPLNLRPIGTGPYKFAQYEPGDFVRFVRNADYFVPGAPGFDEYIIRIVPDASGRVNAFLDGEVDMLLSSAVAPTELGRLRAVPDVEMFASKLSGGMFWATINTRAGPYRDVRVRRALGHAIDRAFIRNNILPGISENVVGPLWPGSPLYNKQLEDYVFDPARARALLDAAGHRAALDGVRFECRVLYLASDYRTSKMSEVIAQNLGDVGIRVRLTPLENGALVQRGFVEGRFDLLVLAGSLGPDPDSGTERFYNSNNIRAQPYANNSGYSNPRVDALFDEQRIQPTFARRKAVYDRIQALIWKDLPVLPIATYRVPAVAHGRAVTGAFETFSPIIDNQARARPPLRIAEQLVAPLAGDACASLPWS